jgi:hypothetical protein
MTARRSLTSVFLNFGRRKTRVHALQKQVTEFVRRAVGFVSKRIYRCGWGNAPVNAGGETLSLCPSHPLIQLVRTILSIEMNNDGQQRPTDKIVRPTNAAHPRNRSTLYAPHGAR